MTNGAPGGIVALLFTDLVGSTTLYDRLGDVTAERLRRGHFGVLRGAVAQHGGHEVKSLGDGLMVVFPTVTSALECAVTMQRDVARHNLGRDSGDPELEVRVGIHVGEPILDEGDYFGSSVVLARRLCDVASAGQIVVSDVVRGLADRRSARGFASLGSLPLKGMTEPVLAHELLWRPADETLVPIPPALARRDEIAFRGRRAAMDAIRAAWANGERCSLVAGEPGIGKTRLVSELARTVHDQGAIVLFGKCDEQPLGAYQPLVEATRHLVRSLGAEWADQVLGPRTAHVARLVPELSFAALSEPDAATDGDANRRALFDAVGSLLAATAGHRVLVVVDDVHWADRPTLMLLRHLVGRADLAHVHITATYRDTELGRTHPLSEVLADLRRDGIGTRITLRGLHQDEVHEIVEARLGHPLEADLESFAAYLTANTEGNPFFVGEVLKHLTESGGLIMTDGRWTLISDAASGVPEGVKEVVGQRLARLPDAVDSLLAAASVLGRDFDLVTLARMVSADEDDVLDSIESAMRAGLVDELGDVVDRFSFAHALVRETLYEELSTSRRLRLHARAAETLRALGSPSTIIAHHLLESGTAVPIDETIAAVADAVGGAIQRTGYEEAEALVERGMQALELQPDDTSLIDLLTSRANVLLHVGRLHDARADTLAAAELAERIGDQPRMIEVLVRWCRSATTGNTSDTEILDVIERALALDPSPSVHRARLLGAMCFHLLFTGDLDRPERLAQEAFDLATALHDDYAMGYATMAYRLISSRRPLGDRRADILDALDVVVDDIDHPQGRVAGKTHTLSLAAQRGDRERVERDVSEIEATARSVGLAGGSGESLRARATIAFCEGRFEEAESLANEALSFPLAGMVGYAALMMSVRREQRRGDELRPLVEAMAGEMPSVLGWQSALAALAADAGDDDAALAAVERCAVDDFGGLDHDIGIQISLAMLCDAVAATRSVEFASRLLPRVEQWRGQSWGFNEFTYLGAADRYCGELYMVTDRIEDAIRCFETAIDFDRRFRAPLWVAHAQKALAGALRQRSGPGDADRAVGLEGEVSAFAAATGAARLLAVT